MYTSYGNQLPEDAMRTIDLRLLFAFLLLWALPLGCAGPASPVSPMTSGTGGSKTGGTVGAGGTGGAGGTSTTTGGKGGSPPDSGAAGAAGAAGGSGGGSSDARDLIESDAGDDTQATGEDAGDEPGAEAGPAASCDDETVNGEETDIDCGGPTCPKCAAGQICKADADCRSGSCAAGKCADPFAATGTVEKRGNLWRITLGTVLFEVDEAVAAKIVTFSIDGTNMIVSNPPATGSVFWTAPQSEWNWPPPAAMDTMPYTPSTENNVLTMTGPAWGGGLSITKRFWGNVDHQAVTLEYTIKNGTTAAVSKAPWEVTRVFPGGLTFFPSSEEGVGLGQYMKPVPFTSSLGVLWWKYQASAFTENVKGGADGLEGWAAHVMCGTGLEKTCTKSPVLIKQWTDTDAPAPNEREVELYGDPGHQYVEFEQQGAYGPIPAGDKVVWTVRWLIRYLPESVAPTPGNAELLKWVRGQLL